MAIFKKRLLLPIFRLNNFKGYFCLKVAGMVFYGVKQTDYSMHFFRLLTLLTEFSGGPSGMPCFTHLVMHKVCWLDFSAHQFKRIKEMSNVELDYFLF
jgi:hypothetical protein